jgi:hypothetical protein
VTLRPLPLTVLGILTGLVVAGGAVAQDANKLLLCAKGNAGQLTIAKNGGCGGKREVALAMEGPRGTAGDPGPPGEAGSPGADASTASLQPEPVRLVNGPPDNDCSLHPGTFCGYGSNWGNAGADLAPAGFRKDSAGMVHLQGVVSAANTPAEPSPVLFLPRGYRPAEGTVSFAIPSCPGGGGGPFAINVYPTGEVETTMTGCTLFSLDGVSFRS